MKKCFFLGLLSTLLLVSCTPGKMESKKSADEFLKDANTRMKKIQHSTFLAEWVHANFITPDTTRISSEYLAKYTEMATKVAKQTKKYKGKNSDEKRQLDQFLLFLTIAAPADSKKNEELATLKSELDSSYGSGKFCDENKKCKNLGELSEIIEKSRNPEELLKAWKGWRTVSVPMKEKYQKTVELGNLGARELGFKDMGDLWKSKYDMTEAEFEQTVDKIWGQVKPFYEQLHCYVRGQLNKKYGDKVVAKTGPIPAHLLGNMWAQSWSNLNDMMDTGSAKNVDVTSLLKKAKYDSKKMVKTAEGFFTSLGMPSLPESFYEKSLFVKPKDRDVVCHASAWHLDMEDDVRIKMCIKIDTENFNTIHHELGHIYYYLAYKNLPVVYQNSANDGFHEAMGDTLELSITPKYLKKIGLLDDSVKPGGEIGYLMKMALGKIAFLPFGLLIDKWRWDVFAGKVKPADYNKAWWELRKKYQGIVSPVERSASDFDPGAKYHIPAYTPYSRYFLAHILQFQFHRSLCKTAGHTGPLHECSIYGSKEAGAKMWKMMGMGSSQPWPKALEAVTGSSEMDATAIRDYFEPLEKWLLKKNKGQTCGW